MRQKFNPSAYGKPPGRIPSKKADIVEVETPVIAQAKISLDLTQRVSPREVTILSVHASSSGTEEAKSPELAKSSATSAPLHVSQEVDTVAQQNPPDGSLSSLEPPTAASPVGRDNPAISAISPIPGPGGPDLLINPNDTSSPKSNNAVASKNIGNHLIDPYTDVLAAPITFDCRTAQVAGKGRPPRLSAHSGAMSSGLRSYQLVDRNDRLKELQDASLRQITRKTAARRGKDVGNSVSIRDLDLARTPVNVDDPATSSRPWAPDSLLSNGSYQRENKGDPTQADLSQIPQESSTSISNIPVPASTPNISAGVKIARWAVKDEMVADKQEAGNNDWGSANPSDATKASNVSDASFGKLLKGKEFATQEEVLEDWQGRMLPPPEDWAERQRYNNNNQDFKTRFRSFVKELQTRFGNGVPISPIPTTLLQQGDNHPNGIGMRHRTETINIKNAAQYGYTDDPEDAVKYARPIDDFDYEADCKLDSEDEGNASFDREETTDKLVTNWNRHLANSRRESINVGTAFHEIMQGPEVNVEKSEEVKNSQKGSSSKDEDDSEGAPMIKPTLNIYLRPATRADVGELLRIYNWYVVHGSQPAEILQIDAAGIESRMEFCAESKLPFIVAAKKSQKGARPVTFNDDEEISRRYELPVTQRPYVALTRTERLAGFCCVNDFTQPDFVEHISAEVEFFVDAQYRRMGVGNCLMDKVLEICDRSHRLTMDVPFHCDQEIRHMYGPGGIRDLHKIVIILRKWHTPKAAVINLEGGRRSSKPAFTKTYEDDYDRWLQRWLESLGFEVEGHLKKMGAKRGRYIDLIYFSRETCWQPPEGQVPDPAADFLNAGIADEED